MIYNFTNDYSEGCHPSILEALTATNLIQQAGYGEDAYTQEAIDIIREKTNNPTADVHLIAGGTLTNLIVLASILKPFESVISAETGHINTHETGAVEATGHKIEYATTADGKLRPQDIEPLLNKFPEYHTVKPRVVYISNSTEIGTIYTKEELIALSNFCRTKDLFLYMDGARLASALAATSNDLTLAEIATLVDVFYIGGTKCGALLGEAVVITNDQLKKDFKYYLKQRGAMMAKGRTLGVQFVQLLRNDLMFQLADHGNRMARLMSDAVKNAGYSFLTDSDTNQIFPILPNHIIEKLNRKFHFIVWLNVNSTHSAIRLVTSWATPCNIVDSFIYELHSLLREE